MAGNGEKARGQSIGMFNKARYSNILKAAAATVSVVEGTDVLVNQKESLLGKVVDISHKYLSGDDDDGPTGSTGDGGMFGGGSTGTEGTSEFTALDYELIGLAMIAFGLFIAYRLANRETHSSAFAAA
jgi:hypothetical protein